MVGETVESPRIKVLGSYKELVVAMTCLTWTQFSHDQHLSLACECADSGFSFPLICAPEHLGGSLAVLTLMLTAQMQSY